MALIPGKLHYSEPEAAAELGISVGQLRGLIRSHIVDTPEELEQLSAAIFQPSDILLLRILAGSRPEELPQPVS